MNKPSILRKRYIPEETIDISKDEVLFRDEELLVTRWRAIKPRSDLFGGISFAFLKQGYKISKFYDQNAKFLFWYCDIIEVQYDEAKDQYTLIDLLVDVKVFPDHQYRVLDADELSEALEKDLITKKQCCTSLTNLNKILAMIDEGAFPPAPCTQFTY